MIVGEHLLHIFPVQKIKATKYYETIHLFLCNFYKNRRDRKCYICALLWCICHYSKCVSFKIIMEFCESKQIFIEIFNNAEIFWILYDGNCETRVRQTFFNIKINVKQHFIRILSPFLLQTLYQYIICPSF